MTWKELHERACLVTGAGKGIGEGTARLFAEEGANLILVDRAEDDVHRVARELRASGTSVAVLVGDVSQVETAGKAVDLALEQFGQLDVLVNNAGIQFPANVVETDPEDWDRVLGTNLKSIYLFSRAAIPVMRRGGRGVIVNIASEAGLVGFSNFAAYSASKAGAVNLTRAMALDHAREGIRVNCVCPGSIITPLYETWLESFDDPRTARAADEVDHPLGLGQPRDVAYGILYLASDRSSYVTGHALVIDGGYTAK